MSLFKLLVIGIIVFGLEGAGATPERYSIEEIVRAVRKTTKPASEVDVHVQCSRGGDRGTFSVAVLGNNGIKSVSAPIQFKAWVDRDCDSIRLNRELGQNHSKDFSFFSCLPSGVTKLYLMRKHRVSISNVRSEAILRGQVFSNYEDCTNAIQFQSTH